MGCSSPFYVQQHLKQCRLFVPSFRLSGRDITPHPSIASIECHSTLQFIDHWVDITYRLRIQVSSIFGPHCWFGVALSLKKETLLSTSQQVQDKESWDVGEVVSDPGESYQRF